MQCSSLRCRASISMHLACLYISYVKRASALLCPPARRRTAMMVCYQILVGLQILERPEYSCQRVPYPVWPSLAADPVQLDPRAFLPGERTHHVSHHSARAVCSLLRIFSSQATS
jgi:hypothetical protein